MKCRINAITMLITFAALAEGNKRILEQRLEMIFDLMDFDNSAQITVDETTILLLCVASSFSSILGKHDSCPNDQAKQSQ